MCVCVCVCVCVSSQYLYRCVCVRGDFILLLNLYRDKSLHSTSLSVFVILGMCLPTGIVSVTLMIQKSSTVTTTTDIYMFE